MCCELLLQDPIPEILRLLMRAQRYAEDASRPKWDFAVQISDLTLLGATHTDLRWLLCKGFVEHALELNSPNHLHRTYRRVQGLHFGQRSCFILTPRGTQLFQDSFGFMDGSLSDKSANSRSVARPEADDTLELGPRWDGQLRELYLDGSLVKRFRLPSPNQELVLTVFEEERWPARIDDPLPCHSEQDPKRKLHDTIKSLNRNQKIPSLRFTGDGTGQGICWARAARIAQGA